MIYSLRVCVADDEPFMLMYLDGVLSDLGHHVVAAVTNGMELIEACRDLRPDLIVTDIRMPKMDGHDAVEAVSREMVIPAVFVTGYDRYRDVVETETRCVCAYLIKPFSAPDLKAVIKTAMARFEEFQELLKETEDVDRTFEAWQIISRAKAVLGKQGMGMSEERAYARLRQQAADEGVPTVEAARRALGETAV